MASGNIILALNNEEIGMKRHCNRKQFYTIKLLENLYDHEWCFDHPLLATLHITMKYLVRKYQTVAEVVMTTLLKWNSDKIRATKDEIVTDSHVFLVNKVMDFLTDEERNNLIDISDEIRMFSL